MNWYKRANIQEHFQNIQSALMALRYTHPDLDPAQCDFATLVGALQESGKVPAGVNPERFAAMVTWFLNNRNEVTLNELV